jgi:hypothetical protein
MSQGNKGSMFTFGSTKLIRTKMGKIDKSIQKLHSKRKANWSKKDLKVKYLLNGGNFKDIYQTSNQELFNQMKTQQFNTTKAQKAFAGVITGSPYIEGETFNGIREKAISSRSSNDFGKKRIISSGSIIKNANQAPNKGSVNYSGW